MATEGEGHAMAANSIVMVRPDGTPMTRREVIKKRRGAFKWLPVLCSNDLVHGSWWMVVGSIGCTVFAIIPLIQQYESFYKSHDDILPSVDFKITWILLIFSGFFFSLGSLAFVRAFGEPPRRAFIYWNRHFRTDELLGAWLFLFGTIPAVPYTLVFFLLDPTVDYLGALSSSAVFVVGTIIFVMACYPTGKNHKNIVLPWALRTFGPRIWMVRHLANDWLAGTWFFLYANAVVTFFSFLLLFNACATGTAESVFMWLSSAVNSAFFMVGSFYYVSGSYPHAQQFYYAIDRGVHGGTLTYDAPANLPDYSDPSDSVVVEHMFFTENILHKKKTVRTDITDDVEVGQNNHDNHAHDNIISPMHPSSSSSGGGISSGDISGTSSNRSSISIDQDDRNKKDGSNDNRSSNNKETNKEMKSKSSDMKINDEQKIKVSQAFKPVLTIDEDENYEDDDDDVDNEGDRDKHDSINHSSFNLLAAISTSQEPKNKAIPPAKPPKP